MMGLRQRWAVPLLWAVSQICGAQAVNGARALPGDMGNAGPSDALLPTLVAASQAMLAAAQKQDAGAMMQVATPDLLFVTSPSVAASGNIIPVRCTTGEPVMSDPQARQTSPVSAILIYKLHQTCGEAPLAVDVNATDNFVRQNGRWMVALHTQTAAAGGGR